MIAFQWLDVDWYNDCTNVDEFIKLTLDVDVDAEGTKLVTGIIDDDEDVPGNEPLVDWMVDASVTSTSLSLSLLVSVSVWLSSLRSNSRISQANNAGFSCRKRSIRLTMFGVELLFRLLFLPPPFRRLTTMNFWIDKKWTDILTQMIGSRFDRSLDDDECLYYWIELNITYQFRRNESISWKHSHAKPIIAAIYHTVLRPAMPIRWFDDERATAMDVHWRIRHPIDWCQLDLLIGDWLR